MMNIREKTLLVLLLGLTIIFSGCSGYSGGGISNIQHEGEDRYDHYEEEMKAEMERVNNYCEDNSEDFCESWYEVGYDEGYNEGYAIGHEEAIEMECEDTNN